MLKNLLSKKQNSKQERSNEIRAVITSVSDDAHIIVTSEQFAKDNHMEYVERIPVYNINKLFTRNKVNKIYLFSGRYLQFIPLNDGFVTCPIEWYNEKKNLIVDNISSFSNITNIADILLQIVYLYSKYIDDNIVIYPDGFGLFLCGTSPRFTERASLIVTKNAIQCIPNNDKLLLKRKKFALNEFLDHFIGCNFGLVIKQNPELQRKLEELNKLIIEKGLRVYAGKSIGLWLNEDVQYYEFDKA